MAKLLHSTFAQKEKSKISVKKKFSILLKLMKSHKLSSIPPLLSNNTVINDAQRKSQIFNDLFIAKSTLVLKVVMMIYLTLIQLIQYLSR